MQLSITLRDWIFESYLLTQKNKSAFIEQMFLIGIDVECGTIENHKLKIIQLNTENKKISGEIVNLKSQIEKLKLKLNKKDKNKELFKEQIPKIIKELTKEELYFLKNKAFDRIKISSLDGVSKYFSNNFKHKFSSEEFELLIYYFKNNEM
jgi:DNA gyrase/topoisomerase IV subunit A